ncbi:hypothetical protein PsYK624_158820 [Phanerochaete sordida]|uniref:Uncharacterized protein n=1 Tax=Phanerochaete sordida TaxID=48140 RepID=A0A9P3LMR8_9APHY|nr:hypothetical protein PsYK624_158820 [Phanerochaete sordida]
MLSRVNNGALPWRFARGVLVIDIGWTCVRDASSWTQHDRTYPRPRYRMFLIVFVVPRGLLSHPVHARVLPVQARLHSDSITHGYSRLKRGHIYCQQRPARPTICTRLTM